MDRTPPKRPIVPSRPKKRSPKEQESFCRGVRRIHGRTGSEASRKMLEDNNCRWGQNRGDKPK